MIVRHIKTSCTLFQAVGQWVGDQRGLLKKNEWSPDTFPSRIPLVADPAHRTPDLSINPTEREPGSGQHRRRLDPD